MADDQPMWGNNRAVAPTPEAAIVTIDLGDNFTVKGHHLSMIKDRQFDRRSRANPHKHIAEFVEICGMFRYGNTNMDAIKLKLFPSSLEGKAKIWLNKLSPGVITTWEKIRQAFIRGDMKEMRDGCNKCGGPHPSSDCDDKPMGGPKEEEANYASGGYRGNYYGRNSSNWRDRHENRNSTPGEENPPIPRLPEKKPDESEFEKTMREFVIAQKTANDFVKNQFYNLKTKVEQGQKNHQAAIQDLETKFGRISDHQSSRPTGTLPSNTQTNPKPSNEKPYRPPTARNEHVNAVFTRSGKTYDPPANPNTKTAVFLDDSEDEAEEVEKEAEPLPKKPTQPETPPLKAYKPKIPYPQRLNKEKIEARYAKFLDMIKEVRINVPLVDVLAGMPNYGKFLKDLIPPKLGDPRSFLIPCKLANSVEYLALADLGTSINLMPYSLYAELSRITLKPTRMSIRLANHTYQYPMGVAENMLVQVGKFMFPVDFVILKMEEDDRVPLILKNRIGEDRATFHIDKAMQHSHANDDTCFRMDVIDDITEDELDALLDDSKPFLNTSEKISETSSTKNLMNSSDHLSRLEKPNLNDEEINDEFPDEFLMSIKTDEEESPWFANFVYYLVGGIIRKGLTYAQPCKFFLELKHYFWDESYLFKARPDDMIRRCVYSSETRNILDECHHGPTRGHYGPSITAKKVFDAGFYWPTIFKEAQTLVQNCDACQHSGSISRRDEMPLNSIQVNAEALPTNDARVVVNFLKKLFFCFGILKALISDRGTHFCNRQMEKILNKYGVHHRIATAYHPQTSGQVENTNRALERILEKTVKDNPYVWSRKLVNAMWAFRTAYKNPIDTTSYRLLYGKTCHLPFEIEHRAYWALRSCNPDLKVIGEK
ncbi:reverse transcriptase domain-containing protein [Tanacetum coccineum]